MDSEVPTQTPQPRINREIPKSLMVNPSQEVSSKIRDQYQQSYPVGKRQKVIQSMTRISSKAMKQFNNCRNWKEIFNFHKNNTPWLDDTQINQIIKYYKMEAQTLKDQGKLQEGDLWRLDDL